MKLLRFLGNVSPKTVVTKTCLRRKTLKGDVIRRWHDSVLHCVGVRRVVCDYKLKLSKSEV